MANLKNVKTYISNDKKTTVYVGFDTVKDSYLIELQNENVIVYFDFKKNENLKNEAFEKIKQMYDLEEVNK